MDQLKCKYCDRIMNVSYLEYRSNSYCNLCFEERAEIKLVKSDYEWFVEIEEKDDVPKSLNNNI